MSELQGVHCTGAPRDLGLDQGRAFADRIQREAARLRADGALARWFFEHARSGRAVAVRRDTLRYFPHLGERSMGMARGSGVGEIALAGLLGRSFDGDAGGILALAAEDPSVGPLIVRTLAARERDLIVRYSAPDTDHASVDLALPWRVAALGGVNEHGLAVASVPLKGDVRNGHAAPAILMTQDCLQRFDLVEKAVDWLLGRPAGGASSFVLADATGALSAVDVTPSERTVRMAESGVLVAGAPAIRARLSAAVRPGEKLDAASLATVIEGPAAVLDPVRCGIGYWDDPGAEASWYAVDPVSDRTPPSSDA